MAKQLLGKEVTADLNQRIIGRVEALKEKGVQPKLGIIRVGEKGPDLSYERGATKRCETLGVAYEKFVLPEDVTEEELIGTIEKVNKDDSIHGVLMFRPLPKHLNEQKIVQHLAPEKDIDGITVGSLAGVFTNKPIGFAPCTAAACMEIVDYYGIDVTGKRVTIMGRSLVIGRPLAMMMMHKNATITVTHRKTVDVTSVAKNAEILVVAIGEPENITADYVREGQIVLDVGINVNAEGKLVGDVKYDEVEPIVDAITPVPGGVGGVTTSVLVSHVVEAAERTLA